MGTGTIATEHMVTAVRAMGHRPLWVVSRNRDYARSFSEDMDVPHRATDARKPLGDRDVGFVYVSAQRDRRRHYIVSALAAHRHVLCDGPIAGTSRVAQALVEASEAVPSLMLVNQPFRASAVHQTMKRLCEEGEIGRLRSLLIVRSAPFQPRPQRRNDLEEKAGNILLDLSVDDVDLARFLSGAEPQHAASLPAPEGHAVPPAGPHVGYMVGMTGDVIFQAYESFGAPEFDSLVMMTGDHGTLVANGTLNMKGIGTLMRRNGLRNELVPVRERDPYQATLEEFVATTQRPSAWLCSGRDNVIALKTVESIAVSIKRRRVVPV